MPLNFQEIFYSEVCWANKELHTSLESPSKAKIKLGIIACIVSTRLGWKWSFTAWNGPCSISDEQDYSYKIMYESKINKYFLPLWSLLDTGLGQIISKRGFSRVDLNTASTVYHNIRYKVLKSPKINLLVELERN